MNVRTTQIIDYWIGVPVCAVLWAFNLWSKFFFPEKLEIPNSPKILLVELSEMGSAILAYPAIDKLKSEFQTADIFFLIFKKNSESINLLGVLPRENVIELDSDSLIGFCLSAFQVLWQIRRLKFDVVIDLELFSRFTAIVSYLSSAKNRVGFFNFCEEGLFRGDLLNFKVAYNPHYHISQNFLALVESLKGNTRSEDNPLIKIAIKKNNLVLPDLRKQILNRKLNYKCLSRLTGRAENGPLVLLSPDPGLLPLRGWPTEYYTELCGMLLASDPSLMIAVTGLEKSAVFYERLKHNRVINLCGATDSIEELLALFNCSSLLICSDGGPAHFAPLVGLRSVVMFGPESPNRYAPLSELTRCIFANLHCSPCFSAHNHRRSVCNDNRCMKEISPEQVFSLALEQLNDWRRCVETIT